MHGSPDRSHRRPGRNDGPTHVRETAESWPDSCAESTPSFSEWRAGQAITASGVPSSRHRSSRPRFATTDRWPPLAAQTTPEPRYDDSLVTGQKGTLRYRVVAVAGDNTLGAPSEVLEVPLPRNAPPSGV